MKHTPVFHHLTDREQAEIITAYQTNLISMIDLAAKYNVSRQAIYKTLRKAGIETSKGIAAHITVSCTVCNKHVSKVRCLFRRTKHHFCDSKCYFAWLQHGNGNPLLIHRHSARIARSIVAKVFPLQPDHIVHHEDRSQFNNHPTNLKVFANQGDHIRYHRGFTVPVLWNGKTDF